MISNLKLRAVFERRQRLWDNIIRNRFVIRGNDVLFANQTIGIYVDAALPQ